MKKALVTGAYGQDGSYLCKLLLEKGYEVHGGAPRSSHDYQARHRVLGITDKVNHLALDITEPFSVFELISSQQYDEIYNLAAQSFVGSSWDSPMATTSVNANGCLHLLDAIRRFSPHTKFYQASTSEMFGKVREEVQSEKTPFYPRSPYGVSKLFAHSLTINYRESFNLFACSGILFNHESPLRGLEFVTKKITVGLARYKVGNTSKGNSLRLGNLESKRDWGYAPDYVMGMWQMLQADSPDDFVLATGQTFSIRDFILAAASELQLDLEWVGVGLSEKALDRKTGAVVIEIDPSFFRPAEVDILLGNPRKANETLGWKASTLMPEIARLMVNFDYREMLKGAR